MKPTADLTLFSQIQKSNREAFNELFRRYYTPLCRYALKITGTEAEAEDAVQFVFIHLWENRQKLTVKTAGTAYLFTSVRLKVFENIRKTQTRQKYQNDFSGEQDTQTSETTSELDNYELSCLIWNAVEQLPEKCAEIFRLSRDEGLTYNEIAQHLDISVKTVENQMGIAFKKLRDILYPQLREKGWGKLRIQSFLLAILFY